MEDLRRLVRILSKRKQRQYPLLELKSVNEHSSKESVFFRYIRKGMVQTDDDASMLIYGTKSDDDRFRMLKSRLKQKILNHMFFLDFTENNQKPSQQYEQECIQYLHQAKMLMYTGELKVAKGLLLKALTTAERCEFTNLIIQSLEDLVKIYSDNCQPHLFDDAVRKLAEKRELYKLELEAREQYYYIKMMIIKSVNSRKKNLEKAEKSIKEIEKIWNKTETYNVFEYLINLIVLYNQLIGNYKSIIPVLKEIEKGTFRGHTLNVYRTDMIQNVKSLAFNYFKSWNFEEGIKYVERNIELFDKSSHDWFTIMEIYVEMLVFHKDFKLANEVMDRVFENKFFERLSDSDKDKWKLMNVYLQFALSGNFYLRQYNFKNIIENIPQYDKQKEGFNFAIIVLQILFYIESRDINQLIKRRDELKIYMANHFKENFSYRSRTFYKLLNIVVENKLDLKEVQFKTRYLIKKLQANKIVGSSYEEIEIVPYEHLWGVIINMLKHNDVRSF